MTLPVPHDRSGESAEGPRSANAAAYCGDAHGLSWRADGPAPADIVEIPVLGRTAIYRLARHPRSGRPAIDHRHRFLYVPAPGFWRRLVDGQAHRVVL